MDEILKRYARSFFLTLQMLPKALRKPISLAYLLARAADTLADEPGLGLNNSERLALILDLEKQLETPQVFENFYRSLEQKHPSLLERDIFRALGELTSVNQSLAPTTQAQVRAVVGQLLQAMKRDLELSDGTLYCCQNMFESEAYTYAAAGCVGKFWANLCFDLIPSFQPDNPEMVIEAAIHYGKALQWTNILRDISKDIRNHRCYLPKDALSEIGLCPDQLMNASSIETFRPLYNRLLNHAYAYFVEGWRFVESLPHREMRLRLASSWPALIGLKTLNLLANPDLNPLDASARLKIDRSEIYSMIFSTSTQFLLPGRAQAIFDSYRQALSQRSVTAQSFVAP